MNDKDFRALVARMRQAQKDYFRTRDREALKRSKEWERLVDIELASEVQTSAKELISKGFVFTRYLATEYHEYEQQTVFIKETALRREEIDIFELFTEPSLF